MPRGKFTVIEGGEGSGKTSCVNYTKKSFPEREFVFTREPGGTKIGEKIRAILMDNLEITTLTELFLFCAARAEHCSQVIRPALRKGLHVICDRFSASTYAYQIIGAQKEEYHSIFMELNYIATNDLKPDMVVYLDIDPVVGLERRGKAGGITKFDERDFAFHQRVRNGFLEQAERNVNWVIVDASRDNFVVKEEVKYIIRNFLFRGRMGL